MTKYIVKVFFIPSNHIIEAPNEELAKEIANIQLEYYDAPCVDCMEVEEDE